MNGLRAEPRLDRAVDHALQPPAVNGELRHIMTGRDAARLAPDLLAMTVQIIQFVGADGDCVERIEQAESCQLSDRMRQRIDADAEFADRLGLLEQLAGNASRAQHQRRGEPSDAAADDDRFHHATPLTNTLADFRHQDIAWEGRSHGPCCTAWLDPVMNVLRPRHSGMRPPGRKPGIQHLAPLWIPGSHALLAPRDDVLWMDTRVKPAYDGPESDTLRRTGTEA